MSLKIIIARDQPFFRKISPRIYGSFIIVDTYWRLMKEDVRWEISIRGEIRHTQKKNLLQPVQKIAGGQRRVKLHKLGSRDVDMMVEATFPELINDQLIIDLQAKYEFVNRETILTIPPVERKWLLIARAPQFIDEWDFEANKDIDLNTVRVGHGMKAYWLCPYKPHNYLCAVNHRIGRDDGCRECGFDKIRKIDKDVIAKHIVDFNANKDSSKITTFVKGDDLEEWVLQLLIPRYTAQRIGHIGNPKFDILADIGDGLQRGIQVKQLSYKKGESFYTKAHDGKILAESYPSKTLMLMVDETKTRFIVRFSDELTTNSASFSKFLDKEEFIAEIDRLLQTTIIVNDIINYMSEKYAVEYLSVRRLKGRCDEFSLSFRYNSTNADTIDCFIEDQHIQCKFSALNNRGSGATYRMHTHKGAGVIDGKPIYQPYFDTDFHFLIVEVGGINGKPNLYEGNFCIIPMQFLIADGRVRTNEVKGSLSMTVCPPDYSKPHPTKQFWNRFDLLKPTITP